MNPGDPQFAAAVWVALTSVVALVLFGFDKWRAGRKGRRVAESTLWWISALGGWPGGLLAILLFRHKSAKGSFQLKFAAAFVVWAALLYGAWRWGPDVWSGRAHATGVERSAAGLPRLHREC